MKPVERFKQSGIKPGYVASELGLTPGAISQWDRVPPTRVLDVERITGISRHVLRPDLYPVEAAAE